MNEKLKRDAATNEAFQSVSAELAKQRRELHELRQRLDAYPALAGRHGAYNLDALDELVEEVHKGTEIMNLLVERLDDLERRTADSDEAEQIWHGRLGPLLPWEGWCDSDEPSTGPRVTANAETLADTILAYLRAREKRTAIEGALQQARQRESQLAADVRRMAPGPGMYRVGDEYVVVSPDEVYPAAAPVEVSS